MKKDKQTKSMKQKDSTEETNMGFFVLRDKKQVWSKKDPQYVYAIEYAGKNQGLYDHRMPRRLVVGDSIIRSFQVYDGTMRDCSVKDANGYISFCTKENNAMLERNKDMLIPAVRAPAWDDGVTDQEFDEAEELYGDQAKDFIVLGRQIKEADEIFKKCLLPNGPVCLPDKDNEIVILSKELRPITFLHGPSRIPGLPHHSGHLKQSLSTFKPVMRVLYSAASLKGDLDNTVGDVSAKEFYGQLENTLRFKSVDPPRLAFSDPQGIVYKSATATRWFGGGQNSSGTISRVASDPDNLRLVATTGDALMAATSVIYQGMKSTGNKEPTLMFMPMKNIFKWHYVGNSDDSKVENLTAKLREWQEKRRARLSTLQIQKVDTAANNATKRKPVKKATKKVLDEFPDLEGQPKKLTEEVNKKLKSWEYDETTEKVVKNAQTSIRKDKKIKNI